MWRRGGAVISEMIPRCPNRPTFLQSNAPTILFGLVESLCYRYLIGNSHTKSKDRIGLDRFALRAGDKRGEC